VTVGETLTQARNQAGLSVDELSERTRIRETVIRSIELDDYAACGGDLYVRGYVRALASAVGIDAQPLIREFDLGRSGGQDRRGGRGNALAPLPAEPAYDAHRDPDATRFDLPPISEDSAPTAFDLPAVTDDTPPPDAAVMPAAIVSALVTPTVYNPQLALPPVTESTFRTPAAPPAADDAPATRLDLPPVTEDLMAAGYALGPAVQAPCQQRPVNGGKRRRGLIAATAVAAVLVVAGTLAVHYASEGTASRNLADTTAPTAAASTSAVAKTAPGKTALGKTAPGKTALGKAASGRTPAGGTAAAARASAAAQASAQAAARASAAAKARAAAAARKAGAVVQLPIVAARAFGPDGFADGDNENIASYAIARKAPLPWSTQWYATPEFGMLKHGTGLLLDLGRAETVTSVRLDLSQYRGASLQLKAGNGTAAGDLTVVAAARGAGGIVRLALAHPVTARYLLVWFTLLPSNGAGQYQESIYRVVAKGQR
jgi:hypothetical protein